MQNFKVFVGIRQNFLKNLINRNVGTYETVPTKEHHEAFLKNCIDIIMKDCVFKSTRRESKVVEWVNPQDMHKKVDLSLQSAGTTHKNLEKLVKDIIKYSVKTGHPYFVNQLFSSIDPYGLVGQWLTDALNASVYTYEVAPVLSLMEQEVLKELRTIVGFEGGKGDGFFCPGGSVANGLGINLGRHKMMPDIKQTGLHGVPRLVFFVSEDSHYSNKKFASLLGIGTNNIYFVRVDGRGKMDVGHLTELIEKSISEGAKPFLVVATSGTTVLGAYDPIEKIFDVCQKYKLWLHVDAAWGGGALMSKKYKHLMKGIDKADSVTWNLHKLLGAPQQCSAFLVRDENILSSAHSVHARYLFQSDKFYDSKYDTGDKHVLCGRRADAVKFWFMWKAKGTKGFEAHVDRVFDNAHFFKEQIEKRPGFKIVLKEPECTNITFWYIPKSLRGKENEPDFQKRLNAVAPKMKERMMKDGSMMVNFQPQKKNPNFFRIVFQNSSLTHDDMLHLIKNFERLGEDL